MRLEQVLTNPISSQGLDTVTRPTRRHRSNEPGTARRDLDLEGPAWAEIVARRDPTTEALRVLANPFLAIAAVFGLVWWVREGLVGTSQMVRVLLFAGFVPVALWLLQFHCLDCGETGRLLAWKRHLCPAVAERRVRGVVRRFRGPHPLIQTFLWLWVFAIVAYLVLHPGIAEVRS